jgi:D-threo-aldose 1-dehydrogenase
MRVESREAEIEASGTSRDRMARRSVTTVKDLEQTSSDRGPAPERRSAAREATLGFGCASLYGLPAKRDRRAVLESAYDFGIRHFDVAPIYGLGFAEVELAEFIGRRTDIRVATKFGSRPTIVGRLAGLTQRPIRRVFQLSPALKARARGRRDGGIVEGMLYSERDFSVANARRSLVASLRTLGVARIDYFLLHEPVGAPTHDYHDLVDYLESERRNGLIEHWGPAGDLAHMDASLASLSGHATAHQFPYDLIGGYWGPRPERGRATITFGLISTAFPRVQTLLAHDTGLRHQCSELLDADLTDQRTVIRLLVRNAVKHNEFGTVLVSSTKIGNLKTVCEAADAPLRNEAEVASMIRLECRHAAIP